MINEINRRQFCGNNDNSKMRKSSSRQQQQQKLQFPSNIIRMKFQMWKEKIILKKNCLRWNSLIKMSYLNRKRACEMKKRTWRKFFFIFYAEDFFFFIINSNETCKRGCFLKIFSSRNGENEFYLLCRLYFRYKTTTTIMVFLLHVKKRWKGWLMRWKIHLHYE